MNTCPNGYICINHFQAILLIVLLLSVMYGVNNDNYKKLFSNDKLELQVQQNQLQIQQNKLNQQETAFKNKQSELTHHEYNDTHDSRLLSNPLYPPLKRGIPINIETRESGGDFQQFGILSKNAINDDSETPGNNTDSVILPLYGKQTYRGSNLYLYYTETDKLNPVKIPVNYKNKDCTDDSGCQEIYDGDLVSIPSYNGDFTAKIYKLNKPRYIPFV